MIPIQLKANIKSNTKTGTVYFALFKKRPLSLHIKNNSDVHPGGGRGPELAEIFITNKAEHQGM